MHWSEIEGDRWERVEQVEVGPEGVEPHRLAFVAKHPDLDPSKDIRMEVWSGRHSEDEPLHTVGVRFYLRSESA